MARHFCPGLLNMSQTNTAEDIHAYLARHVKKELLRFLTCGSVDDGKSTLIGRLLHDTKMIYEDQLAAVRRDSVKHGTTGGTIDLALLTDGLKAEREQGITIDVAYRYFSTDKRKFIIADTPGHEQYTRNMATGASTCQLAIILIDARHGVVQQTRRHSFICSLLGISHLVVAVNKMDLVGFDQAVFDGIVADFRNFAGKLNIRDVHFIPMSALLGDNIVEHSANMPWYKGTALLNHLETVHIASDRNLTDMRFPVQLALRPDLNFRGFAGAVASGVIKKGDPVVALPSGRHSRVKSIVTFDGELEQAAAPLAVTVTLEDELDISRGDMLASPETRPHFGHDLQAMVVWMHEKPLDPGRSYVIKHGARMLSGEISVRHGVDINTLENVPAERLELNGVGRCAIALNQPLAFDAYARNRVTGALIIIDRDSNATVGAGMILEPEEGDAPVDAWSAATDMPADRPASHVTAAARARRFGHRPTTLLLTGLTGAGKATIAYALEKRLFDAGCAVTVLHGQSLRRGMDVDLGFSADDRSEHLRRAAEVARIMNDGGMICICAFLAPHAAVREKVRQRIGPDKFLEISLTAPLEVCKARDTTGVYRRAEAGQIKSFPGISAVYETPERPDLLLDTGGISVEESVERIMALLAQRGIVRP